MGNPFGLGGTVTAGIVSAVSRDIGAGPYDQFIQVDAPINQGNSGGPLFTQDGKVIGMNTAILSPSGGSVGIGFAIPSDMIRTVAAQLEKDGNVMRGYVGVEAQQITPATAQAMHLKMNDGALLAGVQPDGPAARAGSAARRRDPVGERHRRSPIRRNSRSTWLPSKPGDEAHLSVLHDGQSKDVALKVGTLPNEQTASNDNQGSARTRPNRPGAGAAVARHAQSARCAGRHAGRGGAAACSRARRPRRPDLQPGDVIVGVGTHPVNSPAEAAQGDATALNGNDHALALRVIRNGQPVFVGVTLGNQSSQG